MEHHDLNDRDLEQLTTRGITATEIERQLDRLRSGFDSIDLARACTVGDGIERIDTEGHAHYIDAHEQAMRDDRVGKFVPASGAASRMFAALDRVLNTVESIADRDLDGWEAGEDPARRDVARFLRQIHRFAFSSQLPAPDKANLRPVLEHLLTESGLNFRVLPKGLIPFHRYGSTTRTSFEEHLAEAAQYVSPPVGETELHFTVATDFADAVRAHLEGSELKRLARFRLDFSTQLASTDTMAAHADGRPLRDAQGDLMMRPGGHGALLTNLAVMGGDIVFIKNIDNVVPDHLRDETIHYKKLLGGVLADRQRQSFQWLQRLKSNQADLKEALVFLRESLHVEPPDGIENDDSGLRTYLIDRFDRPLRVCGMVRNEGEPGGGPFWVRTSSGETTLQIVEGAQIDSNSTSQKSIFAQSTHFNPVDLVCGLRNAQGRAYDLQDFVDEDMGILTEKSKDGQTVRALEHPGLWNGSMARWNTVFVEVPIATFTPVKTVLDLLRPSHQPLA